VPQPAPQEGQAAQSILPPAVAYPPEAERRQLTVMFCDVADSTALSHQLDPEDYCEVIRAYQAACAEVVQRFDGYIAQYLGDGLLVYFGDPVAHEDDAVRAVRAGLGILDAIRVLHARLAQDKGIDLAVRIGIHTGLVVVGEVGGGTRQERLALGETPNIASRLQSLATPGRVVLLAGEAGIGRSRITQALREHLSDEPHLRLRAQCLPYYSNSAFYPFIAHLERAMACERDAPPTEKLDALEALLARAGTPLEEVVPLFAALLSIPSGDRYAPRTLSPQRQKDKTIEALIDQVGGLASATKPASYWHRSTAGSPRGSTPRTFKRPKRCWKIWGDKPRSPGRILEAFASRRICRSFSARSGQWNNVVS